MFGRFNDWTDDCIRTYLLVTTDDEWEEVDCLPGEVREAVFAFSDSGMGPPRSVRVFEMVELAQLDDETGTYYFMEDDYG